MMTVSCHRWRCLLAIKITNMQINHKINKTERHRARLCVTVRFKERSLFSVQSRSKIQNRSPNYHAQTLSEVHSKRY